MNANESFVDYILSPQAVRERTAKVFELSRAGKGQFQLHLDRLENIADLVVEVIHQKYPDLNIPYHSRRGHFKAGSPARWQQFQQEIAGLDLLERARTEFDLIITSVLLDAGAGPDWKYRDPLDSQFYSRSEGLAVASFYCFKQGMFSSESKKPMLANAEGLINFTAEKLADSFQVTPENPMVGLEGRAQLIQSLGQVMTRNGEYFPGERPGGLVDYFLEKYGKSLQAEDILKTVLRSMGKIWPGRINEDGVNLGDVWQYSLLGEGRDSCVPLHKLSQWLTYSLIEPLQEAGFEVLNLDGLTGLAEYRNGGLFLDGEVIELKNKALLEETHLPGSELIIEWRALTVQLLDRVAPMVRKKLSLTEEQFPLAKVLEGGTWWAGRKLAAAKRSDSSPPLKIKSDGTVF